MLPTKSTKKNKKSVVVIKFNSRLVRNELFFNISVLKGTGITITEHLTKQRLELQDKVRKLLGENGRVWTSQGIIYGLVKGQKTSFKTQKDIDNARILLNSA